MDLFKDLNQLLTNEKISKNSVRDILTAYAKTISVYDQMMASIALREENFYIQKEYAEKFSAVYVKFFILRITDIKSDKVDYDGFIDKSKLIEAIDLFNNQYENDVNSRKPGDKFPLIYALISFYTTFILDEPIHPVGTPFPGNLYVVEEGGKYLCPVKEAQQDSPNAVCKMCIAENLDHRKYGI